MCQLYHLRWFLSFVVMNIELDVGTALCPFGPPFLSLFYGHLFALCDSVCWISQLKKSKTKEICY